jgi:hypothetical protein
VISSCRFSCSLLLAGAAVPAGVRAGVRAAASAGQGLDQPVTRDVHPHREEFPDLRMTQEEIGEKEQRHLVAMHHDARQIIPQPLGVH